MSLLFRDRSRDAAPPSEVRDTISLSRFARLWSDSVSGGLLSSVDGDSSMRHDMVWACRTAIAQDVSMLPVDVIRYVGGRRQDVTPVPQIIAAPSPMCADPMDWRYQVLDSWLGWGNAWGIVAATTPNMTYPLRIDLLNPDQVTWVKLPGEQIRYFVDNVERYLWPLGDLWHRPAYPQPGSPLGLSPIAYHASAIVGGLNAMRFGNDFFVGGGLPSSILTVDPPPSNEEAARRLKERLMSLTRGNREPLVLPKGTEYQQISVNPSDSQFIDSQRYSAEQVCRIYREDPADYALSSGGTSITYANRSDTDLARLKRRQFWVTKLQNALTDLLPRPQVVKLNTSAALMMTARERHELHKLRLDSKTTTVNRVLTLEDEEPFGPEFDVPGIPGSEPPQPASADDQGGDDA